MFNIRFTPRAVDDLDDIKHYVSDDLLNPKAANDLISIIFEKIRILKSFPLTGTQLRTEVSILNSYRFLLIKNYLVFYRNDDKVISIIRVVYARRDYLALLLNDEDKSNHNNDT